MKNSKWKTLVSLLLAGTAAAAIGMCVGCGGKTHNWSKNWTTDSSNHWHMCLDDNCDEKTDVGAHTDSDGDGKCDTCNYTMKEEDNRPKVTLHFLKPSYWDAGAEVGAHAWVDGAGNLTGEWGTTEMTEDDDGWYIVSVAVEEGTESFTVILYDKAQDGRRVQTAITVAENVWISANGTPFATKAEAEADEEAQATEYSIYYYNPDWTDGADVYIYAHSGLSVGGWAEVKMTVVTDQAGWYEHKTEVRGTLGEFTMMFFTQDEAIKLEFAVDVSEIEGTSYYFYAISNEESGVYGSKAEAEAAYVEATSCKHEWAETLTIDETGHWYACGKCDEKKDFTAHEYATTLTTGETQHYYACTTAGCDRKKDAADHSYAAAWTEGDGKHWHACTATGCTAKKDEAAHTYAETWSKNSAKHWHECACGVKKDEAEHDYVDGTCECGATEIAEHTHTYDATWKTDGTKHWHECTVEGCDEIQEGSEADHAKADDAVLQKNATDHWYACEVCGAEIEKVTHSYTDEWKKDGTNHWHECVCGAKKDETAHAKADDAVLQKDETDHWYECEVCEAEIEKAAHAPTDEWKKDGTNHWHECVCGAKSGEAAHEYTDNVCVCGKKEHNWAETYGKDITHHWKACTDEGCTAKTENAEHADENTDGKCDVCEAAMPMTKTVYFHKPSGWTAGDEQSSKVGAHAWIEGGWGFTGGWGNTEMTATADEGWYKVDLVMPNDTTEFSLIVFDKGNQDANRHQLLIEVADGLYISANGTLCATKEAALDAEKIEVKLTVHIHVDTTKLGDNATTVNLYAHGTSNLFGGWPGTAMTEDTENEGWYVLEKEISPSLSGGIYNLILNNGNGSQYNAGVFTIDDTKDMWINSYGEVFATKAEAVAAESNTADVEVTVYVQLNEKWSGDVKAYIFHNNQPISDAWPGTTMTANADNEGWCSVSITISKSILADGFKIVVNNGNGEQTKDIELYPGRTEYWISVDDKDANDGKYNSTTSVAQPEGWTAPTNTPAQEA